MILFPQQVPPLQRPELIQPHLGVDVEHGRPDDLFSIRMDLVHGANFNDPAPFNHRYVRQQSCACCQRCMLEATGVLF